ncbi:MAG TPA: MFS transporter [Chitinophagaceae bacterium]|nr:MFS transporter [Chitinophagaceae bacterium]
MANVQTVSKRANRVAVSVFFFIAGLDFASWTGRIPDIKSRLHLNEGALGSVLFALPAGLMFSLPLSGWLVTKFGSRRTIIASALGGASILVGIGSVTAVWQLVVLLFLFGIFGNLLNISQNTQAVGVEMAYGRSIMASFHGLWSSAGCTGYLLGMLFVSLKIAPVYHFACIWMTVVTAVIIIYRNLLVKDRDTGTRQPLFAKPDNAILKLGVIAFCSMVSEGTMFDWSGVYFQKVVGAPGGLILLGSVSFMSMMAFMRFIGDYLITRFGVKRMLQVSGVVIATGLLTAVLLPYLYTAAAGFLLVGFGVALIVPMAYGLAGKSKTMAPGMALAAVSSIGFIGFLMGPPLIGFVAQLSSLRISFTIISVLGLGTTFMANYVRFE